MNSPGSTRLCFFLYDFVGVGDLAGCEGVGDDAFGDFGAFDGDGPPVLPAGAPAGPDGCCDAAGCPSG